MKKRERKMHSQQDPIINNWYTNLTGQLFKVRLASYSSDGMGSLVIEYIDGTKQVISRAEWDCLKLMKHNTRKFRATSTAEEIV